MEPVTGDSSGGLNESTIRRKENPETGLVVSGLNFFEKRRPDSNRGIADLQSAALPLGYGAFSTRTNILSAGVAQGKCATPVSFVVRLS